MLTEIPRPPVRFPWDLPLWVLIMVIICTTTSWDETLWFWQKMMPSAASKANTETDEYSYILTTFLDRFSFFGTLALGKRGIWSVNLLTSKSAWQAWRPSCVFCNQRQLEKDNTRTDMRWPMFSSFCFCSSSRGTERERERHGYTMAWPWRSWVRCVCCWWIPTWI